MNYEDQPWDAYFGAIIVVAFLLIGGWIWLHNYHECRTQFSVLYCATHK